MMSSKLSRADYAADLHLAQRRRDDVAALLVGALHAARREVEPAIVWSTGAIAPAIASWAFATPWPGSAAARASWRSSGTSPRCRARPRRSAPCSPRRRRLACRRPPRPRFGFPVARGALHAGRVVTARGAARVFHFAATVPASLTLIAMPPSGERRSRSGRAGAWRRGGALGRKRRRCADKLGRNVAGPSAKTQAKTSSNRQTDLDIATFPQLPVEILCRRC
jgi:hypothetical protein